jgi:hypothetical protein
MSWFCNWQDGNGNGSHCSAESHWIHIWSSFEATAYLIFIKLILHYVQKAAMEIWNFPCSEVLDMWIFSDTGKNGFLCCGPRLAPRSHDIKKKTWFCTALGNFHVHLNCSDSIILEKKVSKICHVKTRCVKWFSLLWSLLDLHGPWISIDKLDSV